MAAESITPAALGSLNAELESNATGLLAGAGGVEGVAAGLGSSCATGLPQSALSEAALETRTAVYGTNRIEEEPASSFLALFWEALWGDLTLRILMGAAAVSIAVGVTDDASLGWIEGFAIFLAVFVVATVTAVNEWVQERQFAQLNEAKESFDVKVIRAGAQTTVVVYDIVVGDLVVLERDDAVPADGILVAGDNVLLDTSQLNGESVETRVHADAPFLQSGTILSSGFATMLVTAVGENTLWGETLALLSKSTGEPKTPLQQKLHKLATDIGKAGLVFALLVFVVLVVSFLIEESESDDGLEADRETFREILEFFIVAVTIVVVAVPEGLPLAVTISLAFSMSKMYEDNNLVRRLAACETMGGCTHLCTDKTGTLTQNKMTLVSGWFLDSYYPPAAGSLGPSPDSLQSSGSDPHVVHDYLALLTSSVAANSSAVLDGDRVIGSKTEGALLKYINGPLGADYDALRAATKFRKRYSFDPRKKRMTAVVHIDDAGHDTRFRVCTKGASELIVGMSHSYLDRDGIARELSPAKTAELLDMIDDMASRGLRTLGIAYADYAHDQPSWDDPEERADPNLVLIALVGVADPVRSEVPDAVRECKGAGIAITMVTGDNLLTACEIARQCDILSDNMETTAEPRRPDSDIALEGSEFRALAPEQLVPILSRIRVISRCTPKDKLLLVEALRERGEVVGVTGDGSNDAPALSAADVGLAMGLTGTRLAINASDVVILDDSFTSIVTAVVWGRGVFESIRKFVAFQLVVNLVALSLTLVAAIAQRGLPLKAVQLLWLNLVMDAGAALALATERPSRDLLKHLPYGRSVPLISPTMWRNILGHSLFQLAVLIVLLFAGASLFDLDIDNDDQDNIKLETLIFNSFVMMTLLDEINARRLSKLNVFEGLATNYMFQAIFVASVILQALIVQFGGRITDTTPLNLIEWLICIAIGILSLPVGILIHIIPVKSDDAIARAAAEKVHAEAAAAHPGSAAAAAASAPGAIAPVAMEPLPALPDPRSVLRDLPPIPAPIRAPSHSVHPAPSPATMFPIQP